MNRRLKDINTIAIFRALQLGDMMCAIPAIRALVRAYPEAEITLIGLPWAESFTERFKKYFDKFIPFPGYPGLPEQPFNKEEFDIFLKKCRDQKFDLLIQMQGNGTVVNPLLLKFGAKYVAGFYNEESFIDSPLFMPYPTSGYEIYRHLLLIQHISIPLQGDYLEFPLNQKDLADYNALTLPVEEKKFICVHPGSRGSWRQWPPQYFAAIADYCIDEGFTVIITGTKEESDITGEVIKWMHRLPIDLTGKTSLGAMAVLLKNAFALISNCTGVSHIADAFKTPSVIISMDGEPERWSPLDKEIHKVIDWTKDPAFEIVLLQTKNLLKEFSY